MPDSEKREPCNLGGRGVLVTRPASQAGGLCRLIEGAGGRAVRFPALAIEPIQDFEPVRRLLSRDWDLILFVSRNAVEHALPLFPDRWLPARARLGAVGAATAAALASAGRPPDLVPAGRFDSENLLALPELLDLDGRRVLIVRGVGGRGMLGDVLGERGAELSYAEVYRRTLPNADPTALLARWHEDVDLAIATSGEVLGNLHALVGDEGRELLLATPLVVVSERTASVALELGFARVEAAEQASDTAILKALCRMIEPPEAT